jgi:diguanylate cyclase (GGDEF)-like protein
MRLFALLAILLLCALPPAAAMPSAVESLLMQADDDPRKALDDIQRQISAAATRKDGEARFWWMLAAARVQAKLERHGDAEASAAGAAALLNDIPGVAEKHRLWLQFVQLDASAGTSEESRQLPVLLRVRQRAEALGEARLVCEARGLELWFLLNLRSDDEAWLAAEGQERCGLQLGWPEQVASAQLSFATLARNRLADGSSGQSPEQHLARALEVLGDRPARFLRSLVEWEAGISLRHRRALEQALERLQRARLLSQELNDDAGVAAANLEVAAVLTEIGRPAEALPLLGEAHRLLAAGGEGDLAFRLPRILELNILALAKLGRAQVLDEVDRARVWLGREPDAIDRARLQNAMAQGLASQGRHAAAYDMLRSSMASEQASRSAARDSQVLRLQARYDTARRDAENAELKLRSEASRLQAQSEADRSRTLSAGLVAFGALALLGFTFGGRELSRRRRMAALAMRDELTGQPNRRAVQAYAQEQFEQAGRLGLPFAIAFIDFDHFKQVNDVYGHPAGDAVLRAFAQAAGGVLRGQDRLGRWGGEEWLLVMPGTRLAEIDSVFERLRERFAITLVPGQPAAARCTFSMGAAELGPDSTTLEAMIEAADRALYRAKADGRNRLVNAPLPVAA